MTTSDDKIYRAAIQALTEALADPSPRVCYGNKNRVGFVVGNNKKTRPTVELLVAQGWIEKAGGSVGSGKSRQDLYQITSTGVETALSESDTSSALREMAAAVSASHAKLEAITNTLTHQMEVLAVLQERLAAPTDGVMSEMISSIETFLRKIQHKHPLGHVPLPVIYNEIAQTTELTIGVFHDALRQLMSKGKIRLEPYTGPMFELEDAQYAMIWGLEIKYYAVTE